MNVALTLLFKTSQVIALYKFWDGAMKIVISQIQIYEITHVSQTWRNHTNMIMREIKVVDEIEIKEGISPLKLFLEIEKKIM